MARETEQPTNTELLAKMTTLMEILANKSDSSAEIKSVNDTIATTIKTLADQFAAQNARHVLPSNAMNLDGRSVFRPKGHLHPDYASIKWHRQPYYNGHRVTLDEVTPDEIATYNELSQLLPNSTSRRTARDGHWEAWVSKNDGDLLLRVPTKTIEDQMNQPPTLVFILREFIDGKAVDPASLFQELQTLKAQMEAMLKSQAVPVPA